VTTVEALGAAFEHHRAGRWAEAEALYRRVLQDDPRHADALHLLGVLAHDVGRYDSAVDLINRAIAVDPARANFHFNLGEALRRLKRLDDAQGAYEAALRLDPDHLTAHNNLGIVHQTRGDWDAAEACFRRAVQVGPGHPFVRNNLGVVLIHRGRFDEARGVLEQALALRPDYPDAHNNLGTVWMKLGRFDEARALFERAVALNPHYAVAHHNLGTVLHRLGLLRDAEASLRTALRYAPDYASAHFVLGAVLKDAFLYADARASLERALALAPDYVEAMNTLAAVYGAQGMVAEARAVAARAQAVRPSDAQKVRSALLLPVIYDSAEELLRERRRFEGELARLEAEPLAVDDPYQDVGLTTFYLAYQGENDRDAHARLAALHRRACPGLDFVAPHCRPGAEAPPPDAPVRVGFLSAFFFDHTIGKLNLGFVRGLPRERLSVTLFRFPGPDDPLARALQDAADRVVALPRRLDAARERVAEERLDVLYYADIGMDPLTYFLAFARLAPVQCVTWGHPVTTGIPTVDYFLSCALVEPDGAEAHYTERLVKFNHINSCYDEPEPPRASKTRRDLGLDDGDHVYACTQSLFKLHPEFDDALGAILRGDPRGVVVLLSGFDPHWNRLWTDRFRRSFPDVADRVRILPRLSRDDFLGLQAIADVLLDTFPFGGGNTCYEAFAFGTPVVTLPGRFLRGRLAAGFYRQMGVLDCVAETPQGYVDVALRLGTDPALRDDVRARILAAKHRLYGDAEAVRELARFFLDAARAARGQGGAAPR